MKARGQAQNRSSLGLLMLTGSRLVQGVVPVMAVVPA